MVITFLVFNTCDFSYVFQLLFIQHYVFLAFILPKLLYNTAISYICIFILFLIIYHRIFYINIFFNMYSSFHLQLDNSNFP